jgi:hypothetical protein
MKRGLLLKYYPQTKRNYKSTSYPFYCDFYIPELDFYLEFQGFWSHNKEPFNFKKKKHKKILNLWKNKNTEYYNNAIKTWTERDPLKRKIAKNNKLNYLELWEFKDEKDLLEKLVGQNKP